MGACMYLVFLLYMHMQLVLLQYICPDVKYCKLADCALRRFMPYLTTIDYDS